jgi:hypothetical protein
MMVLAMLLALARRQGWLAGWPDPAVVAAALTVGAVGAMLVVTELMVRGLYAQIATATPPGDSADGILADPGADADAPGDGKGGARG